MNLRALGLSLAAGIAALLVVGVAVTALAEPWIEFSLFLGVPAGIAAGVFVAALVLLWLGDSASRGRRRVAYSLASFGTAFLAALLVVSLVVNIGTTITIGIALAVGLGAAAMTYLRRRESSQPGQPAR